MSKPKFFFHYPTISQNKLLYGWCTEPDKYVIDVERIHKENINAMIHPFVMGLHIAFANEDEFSMTPDNIWHIISQGFSQHININQEKYKKDLGINFDEKQTIEIFRDSFTSKVEDNSWEDCFPEFAKKIEEFIGCDNVSMVVTKFSTSEAKDVISYQIVLMDMVKQFFDFRVTTRCGVRKYHIKGSVQDWKCILNNIQKFRKFDLSEWIDKLEIFVSNCIKAVSGNPDLSWFKNLYKYESVSGGDEITGEILSLFPYLKNYKHEFKWNGFQKTSSNCFPSGETSVDFIWNYLGTPINMEFKTKNMLTLKDRCINIESVVQVCKKNK